MLHRLLPALLFGAVLCATSCGRSGGGQPGAAPATGSALLERLPLAPLETAPPVEERVELRVLEGLAGAGWERTEASQPSDRLFAMRPRDGVRTRIELAPMGALPTRARLGASVPMPSVAELTLFAGDVELVRAQGLLRAGPGRIECAFELPEVEYRGLAPTHAELEVERLPLGLRAPMLVRPLDLTFERRDPRELLPEHGAVGFAGPRTLARRAASMLPGGRLVSVLQAPEEPAELRFSFCVPPRFRHPDDRPTLSVTRSSGSLERTTEHRAPAADAAAPWVSVALPLEEFAGEEVELEFAWEGGVERPFVGLLAEPLLARASERPRVVVFVTSDTHRADHLGAAPGGVAVETPFLDGLAEDGVLYVDARSSANSTNPSHIAMMTGTTPATTGILDNDTPLSEVAPTLAEAFQSAGYFTVASVSAVHLGPFWSGLGQGFDRYSSPARPQRDSEDTLRELLDSFDGSEGLPLFVWFHTFDAHAPYTPPDELVARYYPSDRDPRDPRGPFANLDLIPSFDQSIADPDYTEALYRAEVSYVDGQIQRLLAEPRLAGAILGLTADHGECVAGDPVPFEHKGLSPSTLDVPLLLHGPGVPAGRVERGPAANQDLGRTLLDLAGLDAVPFPGRTLLDFERFAPDQPRFAVDASGLAASIERGRYLLLLTLDVTRGLVDPTGTRAPRHGVTLYDAEADPHLSSDLAQAEPELAAELRGLLVEWLAAAEPGRFVGSGDLSDDVATQLELLGYTEGMKREAGKPWLDPNCRCPQCRASREAAPK